MCWNNTWSIQGRFLRFRPFSANSQNFSGIIDSLTPVCVVRLLEQRISQAQTQYFMNILYSLLRDVTSSVAFPLDILVAQVTGSLVLRKLMSDCILWLCDKSTTPYTDYSFPRSPDDIAVPCKEPVAVVELGLWSTLSTLEDFNIFGVDSHDESLRRQTKELNLISYNTVRAAWFCMTLLDCNSTLAPLAQNDLN